MLMKFLRMLSLNGTSVVLGHTKIQELQSENYIYMLLIAEKVLAQYTCAWHSCASMCPDSNPPIPSLNPLHIQASLRWLDMLARH